MMASECGRENELRWQRLSRYCTAGLIGFCLLLLGGSYLVVGKLESLRHQRINEIAALRARVSARDRLEAAVRRAQTQLEQERRRWSAIRGQVPSEPDSPGFFQQLVELANRSGVHLTALTPSGERKRKRYAEFYMKGEATGSYAAIARFLWDFSYLSRSARMTEFSLRAEDELYRLNFTLAVPYGLRVQQTQTRTRLLR